MSRILRALLQGGIWVATLLVASTFIHAEQRPPAPPAAAQAPLAAEGQRIVAVRIIADTGEVLAENPPLAVVAGQEFDLEAVRDGLRQLFQTGDYSNISAQTAPVEGGVRLDFVVQRNFYVNQVHITGLREPPNESVALASLRLTLGEAFRKSDLQDALERLRETMEENGFYEAEFEDEETPHPETRQMDILVRVKPGRRARLGKIELQNQTPYADEELRRKSKLKSGKDVTQRRLERATDLLREFLAKKDYLGASVTLHRGAYDAKTRRLPVELTVTAGLKVRLEVTGVKISGKQLRKLVPIYQEGSVDADLLQEGRRNLRDFLEREGYFDAQVSYSISQETPSGKEKAEEKSAQVITYQVDRGLRRRLVGIAIDGNRYFDEELLISRLGIQPAAYATRGRFSRRLLEDDVASMKELYAANGFESATVKDDVIENYQGHEGDLLVRFHVAEGPQTLVSGLKIHGNTTLSDDQLLSVIGSTPGQPYSEFNVSSDRNNILALYYDDGFPEARFTHTVEPLPAGPAETGAAGNGAKPAEGQDHPRVELVYHIEEGTQIRVKRVLVGGYEHTKPKIMAREVQIHEGEPLRESAVVETQRDLYNLGVFSRVSIAPQNPHGTDPQKTMVVLVDEAKRYTIAYGGGVEVQRLGGGGTEPVSGELRASPRGIFEVTKGNFSGRADTLSFKARASTLQGRALLSYLAPNFLAHSSISMQLTGFADKTRDVTTFTSTRYEGSLQFAQRISPITTLLYRYAYRRVLVDASSLRIAPEQIPLFSQPTKISSVGVTWVRDRRNNPTDPTRGQFNNVDLSVASESIGSSASFVRFFVQNTSYHPIHRRFVFARSTRFGILEPFGSTVSLSFPPQTVDPLPTVIPLPERFFAGGGNSVRGFGLNQAGPRDPQTGFPIGGQALLVFNQEFRFPMKLPFVGTRLGGAVFYDAGNVFSRLGRITLRASPTDLARQSGDLSYFSHTIGFGFRYSTPIGPVRVDLAYQLNPAKFCVPGTPQAPECAAGGTLARLPRFQFFFNLGSTF